MHDALAAIAHVELDDAVVLAVGIQRIHLQARDRIGNALIAVVRGHVMVGHRQIGADAPDRTTGQLQPFERLRAGHFVNQVAIDVDQTGTVFFLMDDVGVPQLVVKGLRHEIPAKK